MKVVEITVGAARTFNHPYEQYSNFRPTLSMTVRLDESEERDPKEVQTKIQELQDIVERQVELQKQGTLKELKEEQDAKYAAMNKDHQDVPF